MGATLDALHGLQEIERQIAAIRNQADAQRRRIRFHQAALHQQDVLIQEKNNAIRDRQLEVDRIDLDVKTREQILNKHREALNHAKTNKEYASILTTINTEKADTAKLESRQLQMMTQLDDLRTELESCHAERERVAQRVSTAESDLKAFLESNSAEVEHLESQREAASEGIAGAVLNTFRRVAQKHDGEALAEVAVVNAKRDEYACGGCHMALTLEAVLMLRSRDDLQMCVSCGKILYLEETSEVKTRNR